MYFQNEYDLILEIAMFTYLNKDIMSHIGNRQIISRRIKKSILDLSSKFPVIGLTGPRQSGKTTLLKHLFPDYEYISLEDPDIREFASSDPRAFLEHYPRKVIFDEVQQVPDLFSYLQTRVDRLNEMGVYILSGSQNFHLMKSITQTLAGRIALFELMPFDFLELKKENLLPDDYLEACIKGFYPAIYDRDIEPDVYYRNYIKTYVEKDITSLVNIQNLRTFRIFVSACAVRSGQLLNLSAIANECGISQPTAKAWISLLESSYVIFLVQPYYKNLKKRQIKSPKLYFYDTGLLCHLLKIKSTDTLITHSLKGNIFETLVISEMRKRIFHQYQEKEFYFWRDSTAREIDVLFEEESGFSIFEIKASKTINPEFIKNMKLFESLVSPSKVEKNIIYGGNETQNRRQYKVRGWNKF